MNKNFTPTLDDCKSKVLSIRYTYLNETDFTQLPDAPCTAEQKELYAQYRQYLRDYTEQSDWWLKNPLTFDEWKNTK